jgi:hypothetical protein
MLVVARGGRTEQAMDVHRPVAIASIYDRFPECRPPADATTTVDSLIGTT